MGVLVDGSGGGGGISSLVTARFIYLEQCKVGIRTGSAAGVYIATNMVLYRNFRVHHVFGANTDVGKTVFSALLTLASVAADRSTFYLKPVSTGSLTDADDRYVGISSKKLRIFNRLAAGTSPATCLPNRPHMYPQNVCTNSKTQRALIWL